MLIDYKNELNEEQYKAVVATEGPVLILAGAGTGKTRTLVHRMAYLIESGTPAGSILMLTFTNKAANEMKERADQMLHGKCKDVIACTYHSFCAKELRIFAKEIGLNPNFTIINESDEIEIAEMMKVEQMKADNTEYKKFIRMRELVSCISESVNKGINLQSILIKKGHTSFIPQILAIRKRIDEYKRVNNLLGYDDILYQFYTLLYYRQDIREFIDQRFRYIMIDEYQDTNSLQDAIIMLIRNKNRNLAVVGDDLQSLYRFRGADVHNIISFPERVPECQVIILDKNYRSNQEILNLSNHIVTHATEGYQKHLTGTHYCGKLPKVVNVEDVMEEAAFSLKIIKSRIEMGTPKSEICVLCRKSKDIYLLEAKLNSEKIPYVKYGGIKFFDKESIKDVICFLRVYTNPYDEIAWFRILQIIEGIGKRYSKQIAGECRSRGDDSFKG